MEVWNYGDNKEICKLLFSDTRKKILFNGSMAECVEYLKKHGIAVEFYGLCSEKIKYSRIYQPWSIAPGSIPGGCFRFLERIILK